MRNVWALSSLAGPTCPLHVVLGLPRAFRALRHCASVNMAISWEVVRGFEYESLDSVPGIAPSYYLIGQTKAPAPGRSRGFIVHRNPVKSELLLRR
jgi:hypothetical protein